MTRALATRRTSRLTIQSALRTVALLLGIAVPGAAGAQGQPSQRMQIKPGGYVNTGIEFQAGDQISVQSGGQISCPQCTSGIKQSGPPGVSGYYKLYAKIGSREYDVGTSPTPQPVAEGGTLYLGIGNISQADAGYWQDGYSVIVIKYPRAGGGTPPPTADFPFQAWASGECFGKLATEGVNPGPLNTAGGMSVVCNLYMEDWAVNTGDRVYVCLPGGTPNDNWVGHRSGIVVGNSGSMETWAMGGQQNSLFQESQPKHTGHAVHAWSLWFAARPEAVSDTIIVDVYQGKGCGAPTGQTQRFAFPVKVSRVPTFTVSLASMFQIGFQMASAAVATTQNWDPTLTRNALANAQQWAATTGGFINPQAFETLVNQLNQGAGNAGVAQSVSQVHTQLNTYLNRNCNCGVGVNLLSVYSMGYNICLAEIATINGWDVNSLQNYLTLAKSSIPTQLIPTQRIDEALGFISQGHQSRALNQVVVGIRDEFVQYVNRNCTCTP